MKTARGHGGSGPRWTGPSQAHTHPTTTHSNTGCTPSSKRTPSPCTHARDHMLTERAIY